MIVFPKNLQAQLLRAVDRSYRVITVIKCKVVAGTKSKDVCLVKSQFFM